MLKVSRQHEVLGHQHGNLAALASWTAAKARGCHEPSGQAGIRHGTPTHSQYPRPVHPTNSLIISAAAWVSLDSEQSIHLTQSWHDHCRPPNFNINGPQFQASSPAQVFYSPRTCMVCLATSCSQLHEYPLTVNRVSTWISLGMTTAGHQTPASISCTSLLRAISSSELFTVNILFWCSGLWEAS